MTTTLPEPGLKQHDVDPDALRQVRANVHDILSNTPAYWQLPRDARREMAQAMVRVGTYLVDGEGGGGRRPPGARALATPPPDVRFDPGTTASHDLTDTAARSGTTDLASEVKSVNFPQFVADLIHGTFDAIVTASIKQMDAYSELLKNVTKSLDEYMRDNVSENNARDYLAEKYPDQLQVDTSSGAPRLSPTPNANDLAMPDFMKDLGLPQPVASLDEDTIEQQLVPAARQRMALDRQHLLATMVLMGINRLVVTDGDINAKVLFQLDTVDQVKKGATQTQSFSDQDTKTTSKFGWWFSPSNMEKEQTNFTVATTKSDASQAEIDLHTKLSGEVNVRFRSETFPLDKMADIIGVDKIGNQQVGTGQNLQSAPGGNRLPPPPLPPSGPLQLPGVPGLTTTPATSTPAPGSATPPPGSVGAAPAR
jgi:hypothetical protein